MIEVSPKKFVTNSTVRIQATNHLGNLSVGTGFFYDIDMGGDRFIPTIVTNKHVISNAVEIRFFFSIAKIQDNEIVSTRFEEMAIMGEQITQLMILHPDPHVDLCSIGIGAFHQHYNLRNEDIIRAPVKQEMVADQSFLDKLESGEDILMVGYPTGIFDSVNNLPIVRKGITATNPGTKFNGMKHFAIDCACFPGSSGSPVFLFNEGMYFQGNSLRMGETRLKLIGVLYAGPQFNAIGEMVTLPIPTSSTELPSMKLMINIGYCVQCTELNWFDDYAKANFS